jgi:hypothetical protein
MAPKPRKSKLSQQSIAILSHGKTDMITVDVIHRRYFRDATMEAARSAIRRLSGDPPNYLYLRPQELNDHLLYYCLTTMGTRELGISSRYAEPLKRQGKAKRYAVSWFIHADRPGQRLLFNPRDFPEQFRLEGHRLTRHPFFIDETTDAAKLGIILIDHNAHPRRIVDKTIKPLARFLRHRWFDEFIAQRKFIVAVLTFNPYRQRAFQQQLPIRITDQLGYALARFCPGEQDRLPIDIQVHVIPGLDSLVSQPQERRAK